MNARPVWFLWVHALLLLAGVTISTSVRAGARPLSIEELAVNATVVAVGRIAAVTSAWNPEQTEIFTRVDLEPEEVLKGQVAAHRMSFVQPGGRTGDFGSITGDAPVFTQGERVVLFLAPRRDGHLGVIALFQGKFDVEQDASTGVDIAVRRAPGSDQVLDRMALTTLRSRVGAGLRK
jgi:hypothetical protein